MPSDYAASITFLATIQTLAKLLTLPGLAAPASQINIFRTETKMLLQIRRLCYVFIENSQKLNSQKNCLDQAFPGDRKP
jgi:hypothetical protein